MMVHDDNYVNLSGQMIADIMRFTKQRFPHSQSAFKIAATDDAPDYLVALERIAEERDFFEPVPDDEKMAQHFALMLAVCERVREDAVGSGTIGPYSEEVEAMRRFLRIC